MSDTKKLYIPDPNNPYRDEILYGQPVSSDTVPDQVWEGQIWYSPLNKELKINIGGNYIGQSQSDWTETNSNALSYILNKPSTFTPSSHTHGNITNEGFVGTTGGLALFTSSVSEHVGEVIAGILPISGGGTGLTSVSENDLLVGNSSGGLSKITASAGSLYFGGTNYTLGILPVLYGGTGKSSFTIKSLLITDENGALTNLSFESTNGAIYSSSSTISIGTLSSSYGGTGATSFNDNSILIGKGSGNALSSISSTEGALYSTGSGVLPTFGTLPVIHGGTGQTTISGIVSALSVLPLSGGTLTGTLNTREISINSTYYLKMDTYNLAGLNSTNLIIGNSSCNTYIYSPYFYNGTNAYSVYHKGNITYGTGDPPASANEGDIYIQY